MTIIAAAAADDRFIPLAWRRRWSSFAIVRTVGAVTAALFPVGPR